MLYIQDNLQKFYRTKQAGIWDYIKSMLAGAAIGGVGGGLGGGGYGRFGKNEGFQAVVDAYNQYDSDYENWQEYKGQMEADVARLIAETQERLDVDYLSGGTGIYGPQGRAPITGVDSDGAMIYGASRKPRKRHPSDPSYQEDLALLNGLMGTKDDYDAENASILKDKVKGFLQDPEFHASSNNNPLSSVDANQQAYDSVVRLVNVPAAPGEPDYDKVRLGPIKNRALQGAGLGALLGAGGGLTYRAIRDLLFSDKD